MLFGKMKHPRIVRARFFIRHATRRMNTSYIIGFSKTTWKPMFHSIMVLYIHVYFFEQVIIVMAYTPTIRVPWYSSSNIYSSRASRHTTLIDTNKSGNHSATACAFVLNCCLCCHHQHQQHSLAIVTMMCFVRILYRGIEIGGSLD